MEHRPIPLFGARLAQSSWREHADLAFVALAALAIMWLNPVGFIGGGADDTQYLTAARCWVAAGGPCVPTFHWGARWPVIAPLAAAISLFGEQRWALSIAPLLATAIALFSLRAIGNRLFGRPAGAIAACALVLTPAFAIEMLEPAVDGTELAFQLAAAVFALRAFDRSSPVAAALAGLSLGLAAQTRETSIVLALALVPIILLTSRRRCPALGWMLPTMGLPALVEALVYWHATGDPGYRYALSLAHVRVFTSELPTGFDTSQSPLFNPAYIAAWSREAGIQVAWPIDPWLNLMASKAIGATFAAAALLALLYARRLPDAQRRSAAIMIGASLTYSAVLIYGLAIDPKSRMFFLLAAAACLVLGAVVRAGWHSGGKLLIAATLATMAFISAMVIGMYVETRTSDPVIARWIGEHPGQIAIHPDSRSLAALVPEVRGIPDAPVDLPYMIVKTTGPCAAQVQPRPGQPVTADIVATHAMDGARGFAASLNNMCLIRYRAGH